MPEQEREINTIRGIDLANAQYAAPMRPEPTKERLDAKHSRVWVKNTSERQNHIVIDRYNVGHELRPGERREMDMLDAEIANFQEHRRPGRFFPEIDPEHPAGKMKPLHPILIEGISELQVSAAEPEPELTRAQKQMAMVRAHRRK
jgi:hypothetical protein